MKHYFEVGIGWELAIFESLENAIEYADKNGGTLISEIGGNWSDFEKCWFCNEWYESTELNKDGVCQRCEVAIKDHNGGW